MNNFLTIPPNFSPLGMYQGNQEKLIGFDVDSLLAKIIFFKEWQYENHIHQQEFRSGTDV